MNIKMTEIVDLIGDLNSKHHIPFVEYDYINNIVMVDEKLNSINPNLLYLCNNRSLRQIALLNSPGNILCLCDELPTEVTNQGKLNIIFTKNFEKISVIYDIIFEFILEKNELEYKKIKLVESLLSCKGLPHIVEVGREVLGNPLFVSDLGYNILAYNKGIDIDDVSWNNLNDKGFGTYQRLKKLNDNGEFEKLYNSNVPVITTFDYSSLRWMAYKIVVNGNNLGHIAVVESENLFKNRDGEILKFLCSLVGSELQKDEFQNHQYENPYEYFFLDLLEERITKNEFIQERLKSFNLTFEDYLHVLTIRKSNDLVKGLYLKYIKNFIDHMLKDSKSIIYKHEIVILLNKKNKEFLSDDILDKLKELLTSNGLSAGLSQCFYDISNMNKYYLQSVKAIELGLHLKREMPIYHYNDYSMYHLINIAGSQVDLKNFCNPLLMELIEYDNKFNTNYCQSIYVYLLHKSNIVKASEVFKIHRNSMKYRIKKVEDILNISLDNTEVKLSFFLTFKILTYLGELTF